MLTPDDFDELWAEETIYPRGERREDARHGIRTWWTATGLGVKNHEPQDYIPKWKSVVPEKPQTVEEGIRVAMKITAMLKGTFN